MPLLSLMERMFFAMRRMTRQVLSSISRRFLIAPSWGHDLKRTTTAAGRIALLLFDKLYYRYAPENQLQWKLRTPKRMARNRNDFTRYRYSRRTRPLKVVYLFAELPSLGYKDFGLYGWSEHLLSPLGKSKKLL